MKKSILFPLFGMALTVVFSLLAFSIGCDDSIMGGGSGGGSSGNDSQNASTDNTVCGDPVEILDWPKAGYYLEMELAHEVFHVVVDSDAAVEGSGAAQVAAWLSTSPVDSSALGVPSGPIELGVGYNKGYHYNYASAEVVFTTSPDATCDAAPCYVEEARLSWVKNPQTWCPWYAVVRNVWNCEGKDGSSCGDPVFTAK